MTTLQQMEIIFNNELIEMLEHEILSDTLESPDRDLLLRYREVVKKHKRFMNLTKELIDGVIDRSEEALNNRAIIEQNFYDLRKKDFEFKFMCAYDSLTEVYNRKFILEGVEKEMLRANRKGEHFVVAMVDLDAFKQINDVQGHPAGDSVLRNIAQTIQSSLRPEDLVGRYGGDEFLIILPDTCEATGIEVLKRLCKEVEKVSVPDMPNYQVSASFGCCTYNGNSVVDHHELIYCADQALLKAKRCGKNTVEVYESVTMAV